MTQTIQFPRFTRRLAIWSVNFNKGIFVQSLMLSNIFLEKSSNLKFALISQVLMGKHYHVHGEDKRRQKSTKTVSQLNTGVFWGVLLRVDDRCYERCYSRKASTVCRKQSKSMSGSCQFFEIYNEFFIRKSIKRKNEFLYFFKNFLSRFIP